MSPLHNIIKAGLVATLGLMAATVTGVANVSAPEEVDTEQSKPLPRVLLIGDSICGGYQRQGRRLFRWRIGSE